VCPSQLEAGTVVLLFPKPKTDAHETLRATIEAHLSDLDPSVIAQESPDIPATMPEQIELARRVTRSADDVMSVIWLAMSAEELFIFVTDSGSERVMVQTLPRADQNWAASCDSIATVVRSALTPWLEESETEEIASRAPPAAMEADPTPHSVAVMSVRPNEKEEQPPAPPALPPPSEGPVDSRSRVHIQLSAGYSPVSSDGWRGPVTHAGSIGFGVQFLKYIRIVTTISLGHSAVLEASSTRDGSMSVERWPSLLLLNGALPLGNRFEIGLGAGLVVDPTVVRGVPADEPKDSTNRVDFGGIASLPVRFFFASSFALELGLGAFFFGGSRDYYWAGERALSIGAFEPWTSLSLVADIEL